MRRFAILFLLAGLLTTTARANDGRDRYRRGYPNLLEHLYDAIAPEAGYRVLPEDMAGGADGDPAYRFAQPQALALVEVAARHTVQALGVGPLQMALFDFAAENADTPVKFDTPNKADDKAQKLPDAPRGRHPGGSHDGGLNLDLGYYLRSLKGRFDDADYAACTDHYAPQASAKNYQEQDLNYCAGPADRLDSERQAFFVLQLLHINRDRFSMKLLDQGGMDAQVQKALLSQFARWQKQHKYGVRRQDLSDLKRLFVHDVWGGWARFHHHHLHLRLLPDSASGAQLQAAQQLIKEARMIRAGLLAQKHPDWPAALDARLLSYRLQRAVELHLLPLRERPGLHISKVDYSVILSADKQAQADQVSTISHTNSINTEILDPGDDFIYVADLPQTLPSRLSYLNVQAKVYDDKGQVHLLKTQIALPTQDPRLHIAYQPGDIRARAKVRRGKLRVRLDIAPRLKPLVTAVRYLVYRRDEKVQRYCIPAGWFAQDSIRKPADCDWQKPAKDLRFKFRDNYKLRRDPVLIEAQVIMSNRLAITLPASMDSPASELPRRDILVGPGR